MITGRLRRYTELVADRGTARAAPPPSRAQCLDDSLDNPARPPPLTMPQHPHPPSASPGDCAATSGTLPLSSHSFFSRAFLLHMVPAFRAGLDASVSSLSLKHIPLLDAYDTPRAVVARYLSQGGWSSLLSHTHVLSPVRTLVFFAAREWRSFLLIAAAMIVRVGAQAAIPALLERLLGVLGDVPAGGADFTSSPVVEGSIIVGALLGASLLLLATFPTAWYAGTPLAQRTFNVLFSIGAAKTLLVERASRDAGGAALLLSRCASVIALCRKRVRARVNNPRAFHSRTAPSRSPPGTRPRCSLPTHLQISIRTRGSQSRCSPSAHGVS